MNTYVTDNPPPPPAPAADACDPNTTLTHCRECPKVGFPAVHQPTFQPYSHECFYSCFPSAHEPSAFQLNNIDVKAFREVYWATKCHRRRINPLQEKYVSYFPGMCRQHAEAFSLEWDIQFRPNEKNLFWYMMEGDNANFTAFIELQSGETPVPPKRLLQMLFHPLGILCIDPRYFSFVILECLTIYPVLQNKSYHWLLDPLLPSLHWLNKGDNRVWKWNVLASKLSEAFARLMKVSLAPKFPDGFVQKWIAKRSGDRSKQIGRAHV